MFKTLHLKSLLLLCALVVGSVSGRATTFVKATSISVGDVVVLVTEDDTNELTGISTTSTKYGIGTKYTTSLAGSYPFEVVAGSSNSTYAFKNGNNYLYWTSGNSLNVNPTLSANTSWSVSIDENGNATILNAKDNARQIWWNHGSPRFACYTGKTADASYNNVQLYKKVYNVTYDANGGSGTMSDSNSPYEAGSSVALLYNTFTPPTGKTFNCWAVTDASSNTVEVTNNKFTMPASNVTVTAQWIAAGDYISASPTSANISSNCDVAEFSLTTNLTTPTYSVEYYTSSEGNVTTTKPSWIGDVEFSGNTLNIVVNANTGVARSAYLKVYSGTTYSSMITINQEAFSVAAPSFDPVSGTTFMGDDVVLLTCGTTGSTIYYTIGENPADPTSNSTEYDPDSGIELTESTTIKAIAYVGEVASEVSTATYTVIHPLTTMDAIFDASATDGTYYVTLNDWVVTGVKSSQAFVTDGTKGFIIYNSGHGFAAGNILSGTVQASLTRFNGSAEFTNLTSSTTGLTVTTGGTVTPTVVTINALSGVNTGALIQLNKVTYNGTNLEDATNNTITPYTTLYSGYYTNGTKYNIVGVYQQQTSTPHRILPRSSADITIVYDPKVAASSSSISVPNYIQGTPVANILTGSVNVSGSHLTDDVLVELENGSSSAFELYDADNDDWTDAIILSHTSGTLSSTELSARLKAGSTTNDYSDKIVISSTGATTVNVNVTGSVTTASVTYNANGAESGDVPTDANNYAYNAEVTVLGNNGNLTKTHKTFGGWNTQADGEGTTYAESATFNITDNTTLYAKWNTNTNTVTLPAADTYGTYTMDATNPVAYETEVTLTYAPASGYEDYVATWSVNGDEISGNKFIMPDEAVTVTVSLQKVKTMTIDFEKALVNYTDWDADHLGIADDITAHGGSSYGYTTSQAKAYIKTQEKVNPLSLTCYVSKSSNNTNADSYWYIQVSTDNSIWTEVNSTKAADMSQGSWKELSADLSNYSDVYVRVYYSGSTAVRCIDDLTLTVKDTGGTSIEAESSVELTAEDTSGEIVYTINNPIDGTSLTAGSDADWISNIIVGADKVTFNTTVNTGETRYATVTLTYGSLTKDVIVTQSRQVITYTLVNSLTSGKTYIIASGTDGSVKAMGSQATNNRSIVNVTATADESATTISLADDGAAEFVVFGPDASGNYTIYDASEGYLYASSSNKNYLLSQATNDMNGKWSVVIDGTTKAATVIAQGTNSNRYMRYNSTNSCFSCYGSSSSIIDPVYFYEKADAPVSTTTTVKLNADGYATFASTSTLDFLDAEDATYSAWQITGVSGSTITFSQITTTVTGGKGILLKGAANANVNLNILPTGGATLSDNKLVGITTATDVLANQYYGLKGNTFVKVNAGTVPAGKALLPASVVEGSSARLTFIFEDATGISTIESREFSSSNSVYTLDGRKVAEFDKQDSLQSQNSESGIRHSELKKGLYIVNGKKVLVK